ncbi:MAG: hypothetical protein PF961_11450 [Planctomycetota bacterium]|nr:hypothetical protein [Planctomycetota bacterium]
MQRFLALTALLALGAALGAVELPSGAATLTLVDGRDLNGEVLFQHPHVPAVILRSSSKSTVQSLPLAIIHQVAYAKKVVDCNPKRALSDAEAQTLSHNALWGDEVGPGQIGHYAKESWDQQAIAVWARPGESGDAFDPANWLDATGRPLTSLHWALDDDEATRRKMAPRMFGGDIVLPAAAEPYRVIQSGNRDHLPSFKLRHLTIEAGASYEVRYHVAGNLWLKEGALLGNNTQTGGIGAGEDNRHTFVRFCNYHDVREPQWGYAHHISHWGHWDAGTASIEVIGRGRASSDRVKLLSGTLVVSENSSLTCGNRAAFYTKKGTTLILLDGAMVGSPHVIQGGSGGSKMGTYGIDGDLLFGTNKHPLTRDLVFSACLYPLDRFKADSYPSERASGASYVFGKSSTVTINSIDPTTARVIFRPRDRATLPLSRYTVPKSVAGLTSRDGPAKPELYEHDGVPKGCIALFHGTTNFDGVVFDGFQPGGIVVDPAAAKRWRNVSFGEANLAEPKQLFTPLK